MIGSRISELQLAVMMLTRLPAGQLKDPAPALASASWAFPFVGLLVGGLCWAAFALAFAVGLSPVLGAIIAVTVLVVLTGALHFDGLADFADGVGGGRDTEHCLEIMRDSRIGSYGVVALVLVFSFYVASLSELSSAASVEVFLLVGLASRLLMQTLLIRLPPARPNGLGVMASGAPHSALLPGAIVLVALTVLLGPAALGIVVVMALAAGLVGALARKRLKGQTGDVLGAAQVLSETVGWVAASVVLI